MSTASLRRDHDLIEKVLRSMSATIQLLEKGTSVPAPILNQVMDFTGNFTDICHHTKEEKSLFPALEAAGLPSNMGPIAVMLMDHKKSRKIVEVMRAASREYLESGDSARLVLSMKQYVQHVTEHLWKENNRLFVMAEARLQYVSAKVAGELGEVERIQLDELGRDRDHYERLAGSLDEMVKRATR